MSSTRIWLYSTIGNKKYLYELLKNIQGVSRSQLYNNPLYGPYYYIYNLKELNGFMSYLKKITKFTKNQTVMAHTT